MNKPLSYKITGIFVLILLMTWALSDINTIILERQARQNEVINQISHSSSGEQTIVGPILVVPYVEEYPEKITEGNHHKVVTQSIENTLYLLPQDIQLSGDFANTYKKLGLYQAMMYQLQGDVIGSFKLPAELNLKAEHDQGTIHFKPAYLSLGISDPRGINGKPSIIWNKQTLNFEQGSQLDPLGNGIHANLGELAHTAQTINFAIKLNLRGMENFHFVPVAENNQISLKSTWQHPHFNGSFLPETNSQHIDSHGFNAKWAISSLSSGNQASLMGKLKRNTNSTLETLSVGFVEPINVYSQADRATKYGILFIGLTFVGFFMFEILKQLRIHPAQYTLVGLAMAVFYLLLISLSEHIGFAAAYLTASLACVSLLGYYLSHVLQSKANGILFSTLLTSLYAALYAILASEDNALLMGALLIFGLLTCVMTMTRKIDWYRINESINPL